MLQSTDLAGGCFSCVSTVKGKQIVVVGGRLDPQLHVLDMASMELIGTMDCDYGYGFHSLDCARVGRSAIAVSGGESGHVWMWDLSRLQLIRKFESLHDGGITAVRLARTRGQNIAMFGDEYGIISIRNKELRVIEDGLLLAPDGLKGIDILGSDEMLVVSNFDLMIFTPLPLEQLRNTAA